MRVAQLDHADKTTKRAAVHCQICLQHAAPAALPPPSVVALPLPIASAVAFAAVRAETPDLERPSLQSSPARTSPPELTTAHRAFSQLVIQSQVESIHVSRICAGAPTVARIGGNARIRPARFRPKRHDAADHHRRGATANARSGGSLTVPTAQQALNEIQRTPGGVAIVRAEDYKTTTPAATLKDVLDYVPGVFVQPKWGEDSPSVDPRLGPVAQFPPARRAALHGRHPDQHRRRLRRFPGDRPDRLPLCRGLQGRERAALWRGLARRRDQLRHAVGARCAAGRVQPRPRLVRLRAAPRRRPQAPTGRGTASSPPRRQRADGFRDHSDGHAFRGSGNIGYQITPDIETRFYFNGNNVRQRIPGSVTKFSALNTPQTAAANNVLNDQQRNIDTLRFANKTTARFGDTTVEVGAFARRPAPDASDLPVAGLSVRRLRRVRTGHRRPPHRRLPQPLHRRRQRPQRPDRQPAVREHPRLQGRAAVVVDRPGGEHRRPMSRTRCSCCRTSPSSAARSSSTRRATGRIASCPTATSRARRSSTCGARAPDCCGTSTRPGRRSPTSRAAPKSRASAKARAFRRRSFPSRRSGRSARRPTRSARAAGGPTCSGSSRGYRADIKDEFLCLLQRVRQLQRHQRRPDRSIRVSRPALGVAVLKNLFVQGEADRLWLQFAYTFNDFRFDNDRGLRQQPAARRAAALSARGAALQASVRLLLRAEPRMGAGELLRRQRQHAEDRALRAAGA